MTGSASLRSPAEQWEEMQWDGAAAHEGCRTALVMGINRFLVSFHASNRHNSPSPCIMFYIFKALC